MTDRLRAAAQAALEALEYHVAQTRPIQKTSDAIDTLRAALADVSVDGKSIESAEPFIWYADDTGDTWTPDAVVEGWAPTDLRPLYTHPPRRKWMSLTDEEIASSLGFGEHTTASTAATLRAAASAIEAALKEKNHV